MQKRKLKRNYFSLVELMVVITIIGLLGGIVALNVFKHVDKAKITATRASIVEYSKAVNFYFMDTGKYPSSLNDLFAKPEGVKGWKGPYTTREIQLDSFKNPYVFTVKPGEGAKPYEIYSFGPNGTEGGDDDIFEFEDAEGGSSPSGSTGGGSGGKSETPAEEPK